MSAFGVVSHIVPPTLKGMSQPELIAFELEYSLYKEKIDEVNRSRDASRQIQPASIRTCMDAATLQALCILRKITGATSSEQATDLAVKSWFESQLSATPRNMAERVLSAVDSVKYKEIKDDTNGAALKFVVEVIKALDKNNASEIIEEKELCKGLINKLVNKLEPAELRERIKAERDIWNSEQRSSISYFQDRISEIAVDVALGEAARAGIKRRDQGRESQKPTRSQPKSEPPRKKFKKSGRGRDRNLSRDDGPSSGRKWTEPCLNPDCDGIHRIKDCPDTAQEDKKRFLKEHFDKKKEAKSGAKSLKKQTDVHRDDAVLPDAEDGLYRVIFGEKVDAVALGDSGSDYSALSAQLFNDIARAAPGAIVKKLDKHLRLEAAVQSANDNPIEFSASRSVILSITIVLPGSHLPVRIRGVEFLVVDQAMGEVLLGRRFLKAIAFDLKSHLEKVGPHVDNKHVNELTTHTPKSAAVLYRGLAYQAADDDPIELPVTVAAGIGRDTTESIDNAFAEIIRKAKQEGLSEDGRRRLTKMMAEHRDVFRIKLGPDAPARVPPLVITPADNARPYRSPQRRYAPNQRVFIANTIRELAAVGAVYKNPSARWASPALAFPKPGTDKLRFTVDLRGPNARTVPIQSAMPHLESLLQDVESSRCFANIDMAHAYWQLPLAKESQEMLSIQTPLGVYSSRRLLQGSTDAGNHFQAVTREAFQGRVTKILQWLDDFLLHAPTESQLLDNIKAFLNVCADFGFKIHAEKTSFFARQAKFCGRMISQDGIRFDPRHFDALMKMSKPTMGHELQ